MKRYQFLIVFAALLAAPAASAQVGNAPFCLATDSAFGGEPDCSYRTWAQCRLSQPGVGVYCYMNTLAGYVFDYARSGQSPVLQSDFWEGTMKLHRRGFLHLAAATALSTAPRLARAQTYPTRPITMIVPTSPGG